MAWFCNCKNCEYVDYHSTYGMKCTKGHYKFGDGKKEKLNYMVFFW